MIYPILTVVIFVTLALPSIAADITCNEVICASIVSKCLLNSCKCQVTTDKVCQRNCVRCLGDSFLECCDCLEMCPEPTKPAANLTLPYYTPTGLVKSETADLEGSSDYFEALTAIDNDDEWMTIRRPAKGAVMYGLEEEEEDEDSEEEEQSSSGMMCTIVFLNTCQMMHKCYDACEQMGARTVRWFHDGCCQCVGANCNNYGIAESKCRYCPEPEKPIDNEIDLEDVIDNDEEDDQSFDYGEDD